MARDVPWEMEGTGAGGVAGRPARSPALAPLRRTPGGGRRRLRTAHNRGLRLRPRRGLLAPVSHHLLRLDHGGCALGRGGWTPPPEIPVPPSHGNLAPPN